MSDSRNQSTSVFIHIGMNKTGTSAIQKVFNLNRQLLRGKGLLFPKTGCVGEAHYDLSRALGFHHGQPEDFDTEARSESIRQNFLSEVRSANCETVLISSENFLLPKPMQKVTDFFSGSDCRVVVYLRRHDHWWSAAYNQAVREVVNPPWGKGIEAFVRFQKRRSPLYGKYRALVDRWATAFGEENVIVRPYEERQNQPNIVADLLSAIGRQDLIDAVDLEVPRVNESLGVRQVQLVDIVQRSNIPEQQRTQIINYIRNDFDPGLLVGEQLSPELRVRLIKDNVEDYRYLAEHFLGRKDGRLFLEPDPDPDADWNPVRAPRPAEVVEMVVAALTKGRLSASQ